MRSGSTAPSTHDHRNRVHDRLRQPPHRRSLHHLRALRRRSCGSGRRAGADHSDLSRRSGQPAVRAVGRPVLLRASARRRLRDRRWTLDGGAQQVSGSEPFAATGTLGAHSVSLPAGGSAASPLICVDAVDPTLRFFVGGTGNVLVQVVYRGRDLPVGVAGAGGSWTPSPVIFTGAPLLGGRNGSGIVQVHRAERRSPDR